MDSLEPSNKPPLPPQAFAPAPPPVAMVAPNATHVPLTPMMEFLQRRLEGLEKELSLERERAHSAQSVLGNRTAFARKSKNSLRRTIFAAKAERESGESKSTRAGVSTRSASR